MADVSPRRDRSVSVFPPPSLAGPRIADGMIGKCPYVSFALTGSALSGGPSAP